jgi:long-chain acyl-CoA synthetase
VAAVVLWPGRTTTEAALRDFAREHLGGARVPKRIRIVASLPRTPTGKIRRVDLAAALESS